MSDVDAPLAGIKVIDLTSNVAGPFAGAILADLGAQVLHVESRAGDESRRMAPQIGDASAYWHVVNRNKRVLQLDLSDARERAQLDELLASADVFTTNLRPAKLERHGLDPASLREAHPKLVHAALSAYGTQGADRDRAGYDAVLQARTGIASVTGESDGQPVRSGVSILDIGAGTWLALGVLAALLHREHTGDGSAVATSLFETGASWAAYHVAAYQVTGEPSTRYGSGHPAFAPYGIFRTSDGAVCFGIASDEHFATLCDVLEIEGPPTNAERVAARGALNQAIEAVTGGMSSLEVVERLVAAGIACDLVQPPEALMHDDQALANNVFIEVGDGLRIPGLPITFDGVRPGGD